MKYLLINVFSCPGYSLLIHGNFKGMTDEEIINKCKEKDIFHNSEYDSEVASVVEADDNDIKCFYGDIIEM